MEMIVNPTLASMEALVRNMHIHAVNITALVPVDIPAKTVSGNQMGEMEVAPQEVVHNPLMSMVPVMMVLMKDFSIIERYY